eukprot:2051911-Rhodomonas_salina.3
MRRKAQKSPAETAARESNRVHIQSAPVRHTRACLLESKVGQSSTWGWQGQGARPQLLRSVQPQPFLAPDSTRSRQIQRRDQRTGSVVVSVVLKAERGWLGAGLSGWWGGYGQQDINLEEQHTEAAGKLEQDSVQHARAKRSQTWRREKAPDISPSLT